MSIYQKYCTQCGEKIEKTTIDRTQYTRFHPMTGQKQFQRTWLRACPNYDNVFSMHYGYETKWKWIDVVEENK